MSMPLLYIARTPLETSFIVVQSAVTAAVVKLSVVQYNIRSMQYPFKGIQAVRGLFGQALIILSLAYVCGNFAYFTGF
jgi:hypothetical protein